jgi:hypothetical protein
MVNTLLFELLSHIQPEKKKRTDFNVIEHNPENTKHNETNSANANTKKHQRKLLTQHGRSTVHTFLPLILKNGLH